jgi:hypothetical protein
VPALLREKRYLDASSQSMRREGTGDRLAGDMVGVKSDKHRVRMGVSKVRCIKVRIFQV